MLSLHSRAGFWVVPSSKYRVLHCSPLHQNIVLISCNNVLLFVFKFLTYSHASMPVGGVHVVASHLLDLHPSDHHHLEATPLLLSLDRHNHPLSRLTLKL